jgi:hypothetical protein
MSRRLISEFVGGDSGRRGRVAIMDMNQQKEQFSNAYLRAAGWTKASEQSGRWAAWTKRQNNDEFAIDAPLTNQFRDFALRMSDALCVLEVAEERSQLEILQDLLLSSADVIRVRLADSKLADGTVPIEEGAQFFQKARDMMLAAACDYEIPDIFALHPNS